jgi:hypothetical protein
LYVGGSDVGTLIAMARGISALGDRADHTYVRCGTGVRAWGCWGGKTGGREIGRGVGSTARADRIAGPVERGGITCYLVNGVCHQAANRILIPTGGVLVTKAKAYWLSAALYSTYGRTLIWPCRGAFHQHSNVAGDLTECTDKAQSTAARARAALTTEALLDWNYAQQALALHAQAPSTREAVLSPRGEEFQLATFMHMARFRLGPMMDANLARKLLAARTKVEKRFTRAIATYASGRESKGSPLQALALTVDDVAIDFQDRLGSLLTSERYKMLLGLKREERIRLADPRIVRRIESSVQKQSKRGRKADRRRMEND